MSYLLWYRFFYNSIQIKYQFIVENYFLFRMYKMSFYASFLPFPYPWKKLWVHIFGFKIQIKWFICTFTLALSLCLHNALVSHLKLILWFQACFIYVFVFSWYKLINLLTSRTLSKRWRARFLELSFFTILKI